MIKYFIDCWQEMKVKYEEGLFCSERHFQAELFHLLYSNPEFKKNYKLFIEPIIYDKGDTLTSYELKGIIPDMILSKDEKIVAIIELKYVPHGYVSFEKDIKNLSKFYRIKDTKTLFYLLADKKSGDWDYEKPFTLDSNLVLIYGLIGNKESYCITNPDEIWTSKYTSLDAIPKFAQFNGSIDSENGTSSFNSIINFDID